MSLSALPDELVMKILGKLLNPLVSEQKDYMSLAMSNKRFFHLAEDRFHIIKQDNSETSELAALHTLNVCRPANSTLGDHRDIAFCSQHSPKTGRKLLKGRRTESWLCYQRDLSAALSNKHSVITAIRIEGYDFSEDNCLMEFDDSKFDNIVELILVDCTMRAETLESILKKLKNVTRLHLASIAGSTLRQHDHYNPKIERVMDYIFVNQSNFSLLHKFKLPTKKLVAASFDLGDFMRDMGELEEKDHMLAGYLGKYKDIIEVVRVNTKNALHLALLDDLPGIKRQLMPDPIVEARVIQDASEYEDSREEYRVRILELMYPEKWPQFLHIDVEKKAWTAEDPESYKERYDKMYAAIYGSMNGSSSSEDGSDDDLDENVDDETSEDFDENSDKASEEEFEG